MKSITCLSALCLMLAAACGKSSDDQPSPNPDPTPGPGANNNITIQSVHPASIKAGSFQIKGSGFHENAGSNLVLIGNVETTPVSGNASELTVEIPEDLEPGIHDLRVSNGLHTAEKKEALDYNPYRVWELAVSMPLLNRWAFAAVPMVPSLLPMAIKS